MRWPRMHSLLARRAHRNQGNPPEKVARYAGENDNYFNKKRASITLAYIIIFKIIFTDRTYYIFLKGLPSFLLFH
ncbi:hypothetical protein SAMN02745729_1385 [Marinobacterium iners DSM 11526]|uniref:Uncharacterized protein n=1 Tax=Marinobacterium iners DSM 11526 TaxID=1122198 RepID=A0A1H4HAH9_9GAMM|nr:hypothetical protein SAMN02745729_1385 [Marinobacterium iners DSM 11526]